MKKTTTRSATGQNPPRVKTTPSRPKGEPAEARGGIAARLGGVLGRFIRPIAEPPEPEIKPRALPKRSITTEGGTKGTRPPAPAVVAPRPRSPFAAADAASGLPAEPAPRRGPRPRLPESPEARPSPAAEPALPSDPAKAAPEGGETELEPAGAALGSPRLTGAARRYATIIEQTLAEFGAPAKVVHAETGPMILRFGVAPGYLEKPARRDQPARRERIRASKITARSDDLALALGVHSLRIEAPVPGKTYIGIEVPNPNPKPVPLPPLLEEPAFQALAERGVLPVVLGRDVAGQPILADLARLPHLLVAGATGAGKSVAVNTLLGAVLHSRSPRDARLIVVDPKRVEFTWLEGIPHLLTPVVTEAEKAVETLGKLETEMAHRYDLLANAGCRNRLTYNAKLGAGRDPLPALVVVVDELADLMMLASDEVERSICRVAQLGRAAGIHLVVATQRPSVDVVTGLIKANLPARLAFAVSSQIDSRTILDTPGAERLLGRGDFLFLAPDAMKPIRGQGAMAKDSWLEGVVRAARATVKPGAADPEAARFVKLMSAAQIADEKIYVSARALAQEHPKISASFLQRKLRVGYPKAEAMIERLRADGIIPDPDLDDDF